MSIAYCQVSGTKMACCRIQMFGFKTEDQNSNYKRTKEEKTEWKFIKFQSTKQGLGQNEPGKNPFENWGTNSEEQTFRFGADSQRCGSDSETPPTHTHFEQNCLTHRPVTAYEQTESSLSSQLSMPGSFLSSQLKVHF